jgi:hypothetical protein
MPNIFAFVLEGGGGVKIMKSFKGGVMYERLGTSALERSIKQDFLF